MRGLIAASLAALSMSGAYADELAPVPSAAEEHPQGTLDKLAGQDIPNTAPVQTYPESGSAYTLTKLHEGGEKPEGDNIITKFTYDTESKTMTPVYYRLDLKQRTYGEGDTSKTFTLQNEPVKGVKITAKYNDLADKTYDTEYKDNNYEATVTSGGSSSAHKQEIHSALQNPEGDTISIDNAIFKDNSTVINFNNSSSSYSTRYLHVLGGAIYNAGTIEGITADFVNNSVTTNNIGRYGYPYAYGGAIYNSGTIGDITGDFIGNYASGSLAYGGAIDNNGEIANITGDFVGNHGGSGGAIYNDYSAKIGDITGDFIGNYASSGGAIYNSGTIGDITGDFIGNYAEASYTEGGAIYNSGTIGDITGDFIGNYASADYDDSGGAIYNSGEIGDITGNFVGNYISSGGNSYGGAIYNGREIGDITGDFVGNHGGSGGAIYNRGTIGDITGDFIGNYADSYGGAIVNYTSDYNDYTFIEEISGNFINNQSSADGGAIANVSILSYKYSIANIENIKGDFNNNKASSYGGAIYNNYGKIGNITGVFVSNSSGDGGAIANIGTWNQYYGGIEANIAQVTGEFIKNSAIVSDNSTGSGGAIYNTGTMDIVNSSFINNTADGKGGAIYSANDLNITASDGYTSVFEGNYSNNSGERDDNAIYMDYKSVILDEYGDDILKKETTLSFDMSNGGSVYMADNIDGASGYNVNITGDDKEQTTFYMLNDIRNADVTVGNTTLNTINNQSHTYNFNSFTLSGDTNMVADVDLANETMDRFIATANNYGEHQGKLNVNGMNLLSDAPDNRPVTEIYFAQIGLKDHVTNGTGELPDRTQTTAYTPIYKYHVMYDNRDDGGYFMFTKGDRIFNETPGGGIGGGGITTTPTGNPSDAFNPAVLSSPVSAQAGAYASMNEAMQYAFEHADAFTQLPLMDRIAKINENKYALSTDYNNNLGSLAPEFNNKAGWVRPYVTFENMHLKNGPRVDAVTYGTLVGFDSDFQKLKNGWTGLTTGYIGYNGSQLNYSGVDTTMNGGVLGVTETFYKKNFWTALTIGAGASVGQSNTMYGKEDFTSLMAGVASKTGYNFEFKEGRFIIQPIWQMSYTFVNTFDYTNAAGVRIDSDPMHTIQLNPSVRFIANLQNGWQPYASVGMVWNLMNDTNVRANGVSLPDMSVKPYVEYGVGVQKRFKDKFTGFLQAMLRNGGRNGIALTGGLRWSIGKDGAPIEKVENIEKPKTVIKLSSMGLNPNTSDVASGSDKGILNQVQDDRNAGNEEILKRVQDDRTVRNDKISTTAGGKKIIKQLTPAQKTALGAKPQNTTRTTTVGVLKQL